MEKRNVEKKEIKGRSSINESRSHGRTRSCDSRSAHSTERRSYASKKQGTGPR